jgi:vesicular inhibitory amino acid transporter
MLWCEQGRLLVYWTVYSLDATRCIILHLAATQSLQHAAGQADCLVCAGIVAVVALLLGQAGDSSFFLPVVNTSA